MTNLIPTVLAYLLHQMISLFSKFATSVFYFTHLDLVRGEVNLDDLADPADLRKVSEIQGLLNELW